MENKKTNWENIYGHKQPEEVSWTQERPLTSLALIESCRLPKTSRIIDIGGGDSKLVDCLLAAGYQHITVLDISEKALDRARSRLGADADQVTWIASDVLDFSPPETYDLWHDRAAFHFLTDPGEIAAYRETAALSVTGYLVIGAFSERGPGRCSGLPVQQYAEPGLEHVFAKDFKKINCTGEDHRTPFNTFQNFVFCRFKKI